MSPPGSHLHWLQACTELGPDPEPVGIRFDAIMAALEPPAGPNLEVGWFPCTVIERAAIVAHRADSEAVMT